MTDVLIVDDELNFLRSLSEGLCLCSPRLDVITADNAQKALKILSTVEVDVVVTDLVMPEMDGFELLKVTGQIYPDLPVIIMSACSRSSIEEKLRGLKVAAYIEKPVVLEEVADAILEAAEGAPAGRGKTAPLGRGKKNTALQRTDAVPCGGKPQRKSTTRGEAP